MILQVGKYDYARGSEANFTGNHLMSMSKIRPAYHRKPKYAFINYNGFKYLFV